jgi:hypothetical protein
MVKRRKTSIREWKYKCHPIDFSAYQWREGDPSESSTRLHCWFWINWILTFWVPIKEIRHYIIEIALDCCRMLHFSVCSSMVFRYRPVEPSVFIASKYLIPPSKLIGFADYIPHVVVSKELEDCTESIKEWLNRIPDSKNWPKQMRYKRIWSVWKEKNIWTLNRFATDHVLSRIKLYEQVGIK